MAENKDLTLSFIRKRPIYGLNFSLACRGNHYYLIHSSQNFWGQLCFLFYWIRPIVLMEISQADFEALEETQHIEKSKSSKKINGIWTVLGVFIGQFLFSYLSNSPLFFNLLKIPVFVLAVCMVVWMRGRYDRKSYNQLLSELSDGVKDRVEVYIRPRRINWRGVLSFAFLLLFAYFGIWVYLKNGSSVEFIFLPFTLFLYSFQSKIAFLPGIYKFKKHSA